MAPDQSHRQIGLSVGAKIRAARQSLKWTQGKLAAPDFSVSYISAIERGQIQPSLRALEILANRLGFPSTEFLPRQSGHEDGHTVNTPAYIRNEGSIEWAHLEAQMLTWQGNAVQAVSSLEAISSKNLKRRYHLQHLYLLSIAYFHVGRLHEAEGVLNNALLAIKEPGEYFYRPLILNQLGNIQAAAANYARALQSHQQCLTLLESSDPPNPPQRFQIYAALGQHYVHLKEYAHAVDMFIQALSTANEFSSPQQLGSIYLRLGEHFLQGKEYMLAVLYAYKSLYIEEQNAYTPLKSEIYYYLGQALLNQYAETAQGHLEDLFQREHASQDLLSRAAIKACLAAWYLKFGTITEAKHYALRARELAQPYGNTFIAAEIALLLGEITYQQAAEEEGDTYFTSGLEILKQLGRKDELAQHYIHYSDILERHNKMAEAITYIRQALEIQQQLIK